MGKLYSELGLLRFYNLKTVMPSWNFAVRFLKQNELILQDFHVVDVVIPSYKFKAEKVQYGPIPKSFPTLDHENPFVVSITYEDDHKGTILQFIQELQKTIIDIDGYYHPLNETLNAIGDINIELSNYEGKTVGMWQVKQPYFLGADDVTLSYNSSDTTKYKLNFGADVIKFLKFDVGLIPIYDRQSTNITNIL